MDSMAPWTVVSLTWSVVTEKGELSIETDTREGREGLTSWRPNSDRIYQTDYSRVKIRSDDHYTIPKFRFDMG